MFVSPTWKLSYKLEASFEPSCHRVKNDVVLRCKNFYYQIKLIFDLKNTNKFVFKIKAIALLW